MCPCSRGQEEEHVLGALAVVRKSGFANAWMGVPGMAKLACLFKGTPDLLSSQGW